MTEDRLVQFMIDPSSDAKTLGEPYLQNQAGDRLFCPKCLGEIDPDPGYGLAFGGMGHYWMCDNCDLCVWFYKVMDRDENEFSGENDGAGVQAAVSADGLHKRDRSETQDGKVLRPGMQAEGSPGDAQER